ncbi:helix-turn-helix transcriptional regulator [Streptomyces huiliensis]|uniref:helix-turn-helix transcriptional regulator n=1 Tax=Streptomyces huiliensis TaxID=2876027 RepID=UPI001CBCA13F|nr:WYL domain-containing protein [Streptomyces huiliensis]MBZ4318087.1 WYL domain-containing protein [Streptomyces huiliensis]
MSRPTGRVLTLLELLQSGGTRTVAELADRLGVEGRTVRRYVSQLIDLDVPVESVRGRYGGYRLAPGHRLPPLMLGDDEALAVLLGLVAGRRTGLTTAERAANETAAAKIRRVLPRHLARRLDALLGALDFTDRPGEFDTPNAEVLLTLADAVRHRRPVSLRYTDRDGRRSDRTLHAYGIVAHAGRWYVTGEDAGIGEDRTLRLDRVTDARALPGSFAPPPAEPGPAQRVLSGFATAGYRHEVTLRIHGTVERIRAHLPASVARLDGHEPWADQDQGRDQDRDQNPAAERWRRVELRVERLDWLPPLLAALDRPFVVERPDELRDRLAAFAERLASYARRPEGEGQAP